MAVTLTATLVSSGSPQPVQVVLDGVTAGVAYVVEGTSGDGSVWPVAGGSGTSAGVQVVLVDNRSALNTPVTYRVVTAGVTYTAMPVTVTYPGRYLLQSLDGQTSVGFTWQDNGLPQSLAPRSATYDVPGRARPPARFATSGDGGGDIVVRTSPANTETMRELLRAGRPVVVRTDGLVRDLPAVDIVIITQASNRLWPAIDGGEPSRDRVWSLGYVLIDDPEPSAALSAFTWDDFDAAMLDRTWSMPSTALTNRITNPSFETNTTSWVAAGTSAVLTRPTSGGYVGSAHARVTAGAALATFGLNGSTTYAVTAGEAFSVRAQVRGTAGRTVGLRMTWTGATATSGATATIVSASDWQALTYTGTVPVGATAARVDVVVSSTGVAIGNVVDVDGVMALRATSAIYGYFDGATTSTAGVTYAWTSTAHASTSTATRTDLSFDALFASSTWNGFDTTDWSDLL